MYTCIYMYMHVHSMMVQMRTKHLVCNGMYIYNFVIIPALSRANILCTFATLVPGGE